MRVLVIEDNDDLVVLVTRALARAGLDADGLTLLDQMRRRRDQMPVLVPSARGGLDDRVGSLSKGRQRLHGEDRLTFTRRSEGDALRWPPGSRHRRAAGQNKADPRQGVAWMLSREQ